MSHPADECSGGIAERRGDLAEQERQSRVGEADRLIRLADDRINVGLRDVPRCYKSRCYKVRERRLECGASRKTAGVAV